VLDSRLLSVLTWYHLAFLSVSVAMLGMAAGAVLVFLNDEPFGGDRGIRNLPRYCLWFAISIPVSHVANLCLPIPVLERFSVMEVVSIALSTLILGAPFLLSGIVVTLALTRTGGSIGRLYAADLLGASLGCLLFLPLLNWSDISSVALVAGAAAAAAAYCFQRFANSHAARAHPRLDLRPSRGRADERDGARRHRRGVPEEPAAGDPGWSDQVRVEYALVRPDVARENRPGGVLGARERLGEVHHDVGVDRHRRGSGYAHHAVERRPGLARLGVV